MLLVHKGYNIEHESGCVVFVRGRRALVFGPQSEQVAGHAFEEFG
jgi:hypothetical protein